MIHPDSQLAFVSELVGLGVVATAPIPRGTIVWAQDRFDIVTSRAQYESLDEAHRRVLDRYAHLDHARNRIMCWDAGRYINHACEPSMRGIGAHMMVAVRDLIPGDPLTCDYAECNLDEDLDCLCGTRACRGRVTRDDLCTFANDWDLEVRSLCAAARTVAQPLWPYILHRREARAFIWQDRAVPSFAELFHAESA